MEPRSKNPTTKKKGGRRPKVIEHPRSSSEEFTNREIGWLNFNRRVLHEAQDARNPLLERLRFLSIVNSNLDEFFMKRVGGFKRQMQYGVLAKSSDGKLPEQQLKDIRENVLQMIKDQGTVFNKILKPELKKNGISLLKWSELNSSEVSFAKEYFQKNVFPTLTPLLVDPGHPFPFISNLSTSLGVILKYPDRDEKRFARVKVPQMLPQWVLLPTKDQFRFVSLVEMIKENLSDLFPLMKIVSFMTFRLTRNADIFRDDEDDIEDLLAVIEEELRLRRFAEVVRLEHGPHFDEEILQLLMKELDLGPQDIYEVPEEFDLDYRGLSSVFELNIPQFHFPPLTSVLPADLMDENAEQVYQSIKRKDILLHHPYESFQDSIERFIHNAATDPKVVAIKMTLYRTGDNSQFIKSLVRAAEAGKQVVCLVELKARFEEERNIHWAQQLENSGVHVVYGVLGLKTHAKTFLVVRQENEGLTCYAHIGTGNYNGSTAKLYTDLGLLTTNEKIIKELLQFFNYLTGISLKDNYEHLLIAPVNMFQRLKQLIEREAENAAKGLPSHIFVKMNNMEENDIAFALYKASSAGVSVEMSVRGFCCLRPGVKGLSENIKVTSVIGRFLEHSRLFYFRNGAENPVDGEFYIGSADLMYRNLHARVECVVPIYDPQIKAKLWEVIQLYKNDHRQTWDMNSNGEYKQRSGEEVGVQQKLIQFYKMASVINVEESSE